MRKVIFVINILMTLFMFGCSPSPLKQSLYNLGERYVSRERTYNNSFEEVWKACEDIIRDPRVTINASGGQWVKKSRKKDIIRDFRVTINAVDKDSGLLTYTQSGVDIAGSIIHRVLSSKNISAGDFYGDQFIGNYTTGEVTTLHVNMLLTPINDKRTKVIIHSLFRTPYSHQLFSTGLFEEGLFKEIELELGGTGK